MLTPGVFDRIRQGGRGAGGEIQLTDGISALLAHEPVFAYRFEGTRYDCGSKIGFLMANVAYALSRPDIAPEFRAALGEMLQGGNGD